jgi:hypothetical protein
VVCGILIIWSS